MRIGRKTALLSGIACTGMLLALAGCKQAPELPSMVSPYKIDVQQGNVITQEMIAKLKAGMTRSQVRFVLGSPLVVDPFRLDRWDYVSTYQKQGKDVERRRVTVIFDDDKLIRIEGDVTLSDNALAPENAPDKAPPKPVAPAETVKPATAAKPATVVAPAPAAPKAEAAKPPAPAAPKTEPVKPAAAPAEKMETPATAAPAAKEPAADAPAADAAKGTAPAVAADEKKAEPAKKDAPKEKPKSGFFGRMLDKLGI